MKVWIAEKGCYSDRGIAGVYATAEIAMKHLDRPGSNWRYETWGWEGREWSQWTNGLDWDDLVDITEAEVIDD